MNWVAPSEKSVASTTLEKNLWDAADQFRANSGLKAQEYSAPVLGLIFLRFAEVRFNARRALLTDQPSPGSTSHPLPLGEGRGEGAERVSRRGSRVDDPAAYHAEAVLYLPEQARFDYLLNLPEAENIGAKVNDAMRDIEKHNPQLAGVLPKSYNLFTSTLLKELLKKVSEIPATMDYDTFGRIYEYFLGEFAMSEGQGGGEFYTPSSIVRLLTEVIEPYHGRILDPACGSGGMFVQSARFVAEHKREPAPSPPAPLPSYAPSPPAPLPRGEGSEIAPSKYSGDPSYAPSPPAPLPRGEGSEIAQKNYSGDPARELSIYGVEKTDETGRLCRLNLAVHGLEGTIHHGGNINSYYDDPFDACRGEPSTQPAGGKGAQAATLPHKLPSPPGRGVGGEGAQHGRFDFVLANPPFNVNAVDKERIKECVGPGRRFPFGLPRTDNANYLWIQLFYSSLNEKGRAGFVMANSASDARSSEQELRRQLIESRAVDVMVAVGPNMFYTVTLPCTLWFMDKAKAALPPCPPSPPTPLPGGEGSLNCSSQQAPVPLSSGERSCEDCRRVQLPLPLGEGRGEGAAHDRSNTVLFIDARHIYRQIDRAHRDWSPAQISFIANTVRLYRGEELDFTLECDETQAKLLEVFGEATASNQKSKIGNLKFKDIPGFCRVATIEEIEAQGWSLNPGRYVGVVPGEVVSDEDFKEQLEKLNEELETLNAAARELEQTIGQNVAEILRT